MTKIRNKQAYGDDYNITDEDFLVGSDGDTQEKQAKSYPVGALRDYMLSGLSPLEGGTLRITEYIDTTGNNYTTPQAFLNASSPVKVIQQYHVAIVTLFNGEKYLLNKQDITVGVDQVALLSTDFILLDANVNLGAGSKIFKVINVNGKKEFRTLNKTGNLVTITEDTDEVVITINETNLIEFIKANQTQKQIISSDDSITIDESDTEIDIKAASQNFAKNNLTFTGNRTHDLDGKTVFYNNGKQFKSATSVIQVTGEASYEEKGFGSTVTDIIKRIYNGASEKIIEIFGNKSVKFFGNIWSNGLSNLETNTIFGENALISSTTGEGNTVVGKDALKTSTTGEDNTVVGYGAMTNSTTARACVALGLNSLMSVTIGDDNTAVGIGALTSVTVGIQNTAVGSSSASDIDTDSARNTSIGCNSMINDSIGGSLTHAYSSTFIGWGTRSKNSTSDNEIVIGANAFGRGNGTIQLGNVDSKYVHIPEHTTTEINAFTGMEEGATVYNTTLNTLCFYNGSAWQKITSTNM